MPQYSRQTKTKDGLNTRQRLFVKEYLVDLNATKAMIRAGYSPRTAHVTGVQLLARPRVAEAVRAEMEKRAEKVDIKQEDVLREIARVAFCDLSQLATWNDKRVTLKDSKKLTENQTRCVQEVSSSSTTIRGVTQSQVKIKLYDKLAALDKLAKHLGMYSDADGRALAKGAIGLELFRQMLNDAQNVTVDITPELPAGTSRV